MKDLGLAGTATWGMGSLLTAASCVSSGNSPENSAGSSGREANDDQFLFIGDDIAIAETAYGKVQGYMLNRVYTFLGIP